MDNMNSGSKGSMSKRTFKDNLFIETKFIRKFERPRGLNTINDYISESETRPRPKSEQLLHLAKEPEFNPSDILRENSAQIKKLTKESKTERPLRTVDTIHFASGAVEGSREGWSANLAPDYSEKRRNFLTDRPTHSNMKREHFRGFTRKKDNMDEGSVKFENATVVKNLENFKNYDKSVTSKKRHKGDFESSAKLKIRQSLTKSSSLAMKPPSEKPSKRASSSNRRIKSLSIKKCKIRLSFSKDKSSHKSNAKKRVLNLSKKIASNPKNENSTERSSSKLALKSICSIFKKRKGALASNPLTSRRDSKPMASIDLYNSMMNKAKGDTYFIKKPNNQLSGYTTRRSKDKAKKDNGIIEELFELKRQASKKNEKPRPSHNTGNLMNQKEEILARLCSGNNSYALTSHSHLTSSLIGKSQKTTNNGSVCRLTGKVNVPSQTLTIHLKKDPDKNSKMMRRNVAEAKQYIVARNIKNRRSGSFFISSLTGGMMETGQAVKPVVCNHAAVLK